MERFLSNLRVRLEEHISPNMMRVIRPFMTVQFVIFMLLGIVNTAVSVGTATLLEHSSQCVSCTGQPTAINRRTLTFQLYIRIYSQHNNIILFKLSLYVSPTTDT